MTKTEIKKAAHAEAEAIRFSQRISATEALKFGLRRVHAKLLQDRNVAVLMTEPQTPKFMWLRGM